MPIVVLIRPGCTDFDEQNRLQGRLDIPLNERGEDQVRQTAEQLRGIPLKMVYTAPCEPARSTAAKIGAELKIPIKEVEGLSNLNQGLWQGLPLDDIRRKHPKVFRQWQESPETICPPEGEVIADAMARVGKAVDKILKRKTDVALVAPEPLASLVRWHVRGGKLDAVDPICSCAQQQHWEYLDTGESAGIPAVGQPTESSSGTAKS